MRTVTIISALGAIIGAAIYGVLDATSHIASGSHTFGWYAYRPRRYVDYLPVPSGTASSTTSWWLILLLAIGIGVAVGAAAGTLAALAGFRLDRKA
ncbi:MAG TPA: hypothetical protein VFH38_07750 [Jatrophihabitans sp.]|nr:hypothetical protein [Jatrophihabitans sp.]